MKTQEFKSCQVVVAHAINPSRREAEAGGGGPSRREAEAGGSPGQPSLQSKLQDSQGFRETLLQTAPLH